MADPAPGVGEAAAGSVDLLAVEEDLADHGGAGVSSCMRLRVRGNVGISADIPKSETSA
jgi:hypothetical protein